MRRVLFVLAFLCANGSVLGQTEAPEVELDQFYKQGINLRRKEAIKLEPVSPLPKRKRPKVEDPPQFVWAASVRVDGPKRVQALELLTVVKDLDEVRLDIADAKLTKDALQKISALPNVKHLALTVYRLSDDDLKTVIHLKQLEGLSVECPELSDTQVRQLQAMQGIKRLDLASADVTAKALEEIKRALPGAQIEFYPIAKLFYMPHLASDAKTEALARLKKERFNAALDAVKKYHQRIQIGKSTFGDLEFIAVARFLRDAALDLDDPALTRRIIDDYVQMAEFGLVELRAQNDWGKLEPYKYHQARYEYLDAQVLQLRLKKQMEPRIQGGRGPQPKKALACGMVDAS